MSGGAGAHGRARLDRLLSELGIAVQSAEHPPVFTVAEAAAHPHDLPGADTKNLLLRDSKGALFLVTMAAERRADLKALATMLGAKKLSFASADRLMDALGVLPGAVTPFGLINDAAHQVTFGLDRALARAERIVCHPLVNTASVSIATADLLRLLRAVGVEARVIDFGEG